VNASLGAGLRHPYRKAWPGSRACEWHPAPHRASPRPQRPRFRAGAASRTAIGI